MFGWSPRDEIRAMFPQLRSDDIVGGSFCSTDGFVDPYSAMNGFMSWAADHGAKLWKNTQVTGIQLDAQGIAGVETTRGPVSTRKVVNAAGAWAAESPAWWTWICPSNLCGACSFLPNRSTSFPTPRP